MKSAMLISVLACGCAIHEARGEKFSALEPAAKSVCEVAAEPDSHRGRRIVVRGLYAQGPHGRLLHDRSCPDWQFKVRLSLQADGDPAAERLVRTSFEKRPADSVPAVFSGILESRAVIAGCSKPSCYEHSLEDAQLLAASPSGRSPRRR